MKSWLDTSVKGLQESEPNRFPIKGGERNKGESIGNISFCVRVSSAVPLELHNTTHIRDLMNLFNAFFASLPPATVV